ncbi:phosphogluconate dehydratase [Piscinibacter sakaiensis]|uniref:Phosphogluconate dehydratase n=1 Tax=Piscinibacter sakaiensis TaxID=1547922 RepID=A0A0K8P1W0_PISS1|nr:phosphogluconate dehydratase [Piscinibacter sakaiensis]GAP36608.1 phosphogluconate dehydratase [Piscinibacter sakaiensis]
MHPTVERVTERIRQRSAPLRSAYLARVQAAIERPRGADRMGCANVAHAFAALPGSDKFRVVAEKAPNIGVVTAYNDMLSAHQPYEGFPAVIRDEARRLGATVQVAGGVPAMCDGVTQGYPGMELSLFSRDTIAMGTAVALTHDVFDAALLLGVCDKIVPGLLIGALHFGHLPCVFVPAGPMSSGLSNSAKAKVREDYAQGLVGRGELLEAESAAYHGAGTCTFYGTANSNQMLLEAMGLHVPGAAFVHPHAPLREALTREAVRRVLAITASGSPEFRPIGRLVDERVIVNAMVALLATGGSTNHLIHWVAVARAAGILIDWSDFAELSHVTPLLARVYPNGSADVNQFEAAGGPGYVIRELVDAGRMHGDVDTVSGRPLRAQSEQPALAAAEAADAAAAPVLHWRPRPEASGDEAVLRPAARPFSAHGGMQLLTGNLGRSVIKVSSVPDDRHVVEAPARVFDTQEALQQAFKAGELNRDVVVVVRFQGPRSNGMPELHKLTPPLAVLQGKGFRVALVTDGRMSGASGKVPAAIHVSPEALAGGPLGKVRDGDPIRLDAVAGTLEALVDPAEWAARTPAVLPPELAEVNAHGLGRELFGGLRRHVTTAEEGAVTWL